MRLLRRAARRKYGLEGLDGATPTLVRRLAHAINQRRQSELEDAGYVHAGELNALALLQDLFSGALGEALGGGPAALGDALGAVEAELGREELDALLAQFQSTFDVDWTRWRGESAAERPGERREPDRPATPGRATILAALFVLWHVNRNPALASLRELVDDRELSPFAYRRAMEVFEHHLRAATRGSVALAGDLIDRLEAPSRAAPESIAGQLQLYLDQPTEAMGVARERLERALDALDEERVRPPAGPGPIELPEPDAEPAGYRRPPRDEPAWMRELVLGAKHTHVWLDQLGRARGQRIERLDQVPDEALEDLVEAGITGLWLVGVWERSRASREIKRLAGSPDAAASAYSIFDYTVAADLGGDGALAELQERALELGLRLGVDVVPNHFGIDSRWMLDHPERFLAVDECPFPGYTFDGPDLSGDPEIGLFLEDHYYDRTDAAVVFKRVDRRSGDDRFVYHGNDGTTTPWNDTAQLDYTRPDVRRAMIAQIVALAERFSILRFDAAMTLSRRHFHRLWFPGPGSGGAVPSRSEHGVGEEVFERLMPREFWLDVVEAVEEAAPDTLLVAEAFWLMEPYFVRELGMHRVYNSSFMHLLRERDNARFQHLLTQGLERDPELLRRSVNFMTTPDERSAVEQFGKGDRYFGVAALLAVLPGTPMLGHGQVEGLAEKYGMEYVAARSGEAPDPRVRSRHATELAPLLRARRGFADAAAWHGLEFLGPGGQVCRDVHAFFWRCDGELAVVLFNHSPAAVSGVARGRGLDLAHLLAGCERLADSRLGVEIVLSPAVLSARGLEVELAPWQASILRPRPATPA